MWPPLASRQVNGGCEVERLEIQRRDVTVQVVDRDQRQPPRPRERLRGRDADEQRADQPGPGGDGDRLDLAEPYTGLVERLANDRHDQLEVPARRHLRHDPAEARVQLGLRGDDVRSDLAVAVTSAAAVSSHDVSIAEDHVAKRASRHMISASSRLSV